MYYYRNYGIIQIDPALLCKPHMRVIILYLGSYVNILYYEKKCSSKQLSSIGIMSLPFFILNIQGHYKLLSHCSRRW
jgi:hypothetical protein